MLSLFNRVQLFVTLGTVARQTLLSMNSSRQNYWSWVALPSSRGSNLHLLNFGRWILHPLSHLGCPKH